MHLKYKYLYALSDKLGQQKFPQCAFYCIILLLQQWMLTYKLRTTSLVLNINVLLDSFPGVAFPNPAVFVALLAPGNE